MQPRFLACEHARTRSDAGDGLAAAGPADSRTRCRDGRKLDARMWLASRPAILVDSLSAPVDEGLDFSDLRTFGRFSGKWR